MNPKDHALKLWNDYLYATTPEAKAEALFQLEEFKRTSGTEPEKLDLETQQRIDSVNGEVVE